MPPSSPGGSGARPIRTPSPPYSRRQYYGVQWKASAIRVQEGQLILSNGRANLPLVVSWLWQTPVLVELGWTGSAYELRCIYKMAKTVS